MSRFFWPPRSTLAAYSSPLRLASSQTECISLRRRAFTQSSVKCTWESTETSFSVANSLICRSSFVSVRSPRTDRASRAARADDESSLGGHHDGAQRHKYPAERRHNQSRQERRSSTERPR